MDFSMARSERITAIVSTIVAIAVLAGGVTAYQANTAPVEDIVQLESDLRFQLEVGFMHDHRERAARLEQLQQITKAWHASEKTNTDRAKLADWLLEATISSMAGSNQAMPSQPLFNGEPVEAKAATKAQPVQPVTAEQVLTDPEIDVEAAEQFLPTAEISSPKPMGSGKKEKKGSSTPGIAAKTPAVLKAKQRPTPAASSSSIAAATEKIESQPRTPDVQVNLSELAARITGYHTGLDEVERTLTKVKSGDFDTLAEQVHELEQLTRDFQFLRLYHQGLSEAEQRWVPTPRGPVTTLAQLQRRIDEAQETLAGDFLDEFDASNPDRLTVLRKQAAELISRVNR